MYFTTNNEDECSGCTACMNVCAHGAIEMGLFPSRIMTNALIVDFVKKCALFASGL